MSVGGRGPRVACISKVRKSGPSTPECKTRHRTFLRVGSVRGGIGENLNSRSARVCAVSLRPGQVYYSAKIWDHESHKAAWATSEEAVFSGAPENTPSRLSGPKPAPH